VPTYRKLTAGDVDSSAPSPGTNPSRRVWSAVAAGGQQDRVRAKYARRCVGVALMGKRCICSQNAMMPPPAPSQRLASDV
jgi:hypothetical protein